MNSWFLKILRVNANYYSFLSGVFISVSIGLYTAVFATDEIPSRWRILLLSALLTFVSSLFWSAFAWELDAIQKLAIAEAPDFIEPDQMLLRLVERRRTKFFSYFFASILFASMGLGVLLLGYDTAPLPLPPTSPYPSPQ
jgi:uncharacterized membrane protein